MVPLGDAGNWTLRSFVLRIPPYATDRLLWEMSVLELNGTASRTITIVAEYAGINGEASPPTGMTVFEQNQFLTDLELSESRNGTDFVEVMVSRGTHADLMSLLGISRGPSSADVMELFERNRIGFYLGIFERLCKIGIITPQDVEAVRDAAFDIQNTHKRARE